MKVAKIIAASAAILAVIGVIFAAGQEVQDLKGKVAALVDYKVQLDGPPPIEQRVGELEDTVSHFPVAAPVGAIAAYWGPVAPDGWLMCDGRRIDDKDAKYVTLRELVGDTTPDLRGYFLRGLDAGGEVDPDGKSRSPGHVQPDATKMPEDAPFGMGPGGEHQHSIPGRFCKDGGVGTWSHDQGGKRGYIELYPKTASDGEHSHTIVGGDAETRPKNVAVNFIIKW